MPDTQRTGKRKVGNLLALAVLSYLTQRPMHPYELGRTLREHGDDRSIKFNHGSLYMVIGQLARAGFITEQETSRAGQRPERTVYALTDAGRGELRDWLAELVGQPQHEYPSYVAALSLIGALPPSQVLELLRARLERPRPAGGRGPRAGRDLAAAGVPGLFLIEEEYRVALLAADSAFTSQLIQRITDPATDWTGAWAASTARTPRPPRENDMTSAPKTSAPITTAQMTTGSVASRDGTTIGYLRVGHGPAVVLLHGSMESARSHTRLAQALADEFTVYLPDRRGRGMTGPYRPGHSLRTEVEDLDAVLAESGAELVFGVSAGGLAVLEAARTRPAIRKVAVYEPALLMDASWPTDWISRFDRGDRPGQRRGRADHQHVRIATWPRRSSRSCRDGCWSRSPAWA